MSAKQSAQHLLLPKGPSALSHDLLSCGWLHHFTTLPYGKTQVHTGSALPICLRKDVELYQGRLGEGSVVVLSHV